MRTLIAVVRSRGRSWDTSKPMRSQPQWSEHAAFMDQRAADEFVVLGGPLGSDGDILLVIKTNDENAVRSVSQRDPWDQSAILEVKRIQMWTVLVQSGDVEE